jgi:hypothetical protein
MKKTPKSDLNREAWLQAAVTELRPHFKSVGYDLPEVHVSVGWPSSGGLGRKKRTIGQCWSGSVSADGKPHIFISPMLDENGGSQDTLATLVHELVHVAVGTEAKHGPKFKKASDKVLLQGKATATEASPDLLEQLAIIVKKLGDFPHSKLVPSEDDKKKTQTTRMKKCECPTCGYTIRLARKWADLGIPDCPVDKKPLSMEAEGD